MPDVERCHVTGNPVGTDTWAKGHPCTCASCSRFIAALSTPRPPFWRHRVALTFELEAYYDPSEESPESAGTRVLGLIARVLDDDADWAARIRATVKEPKLEVHRVPCAHDGCAYAIDATSAQEMAEHGYRLKNGTESDPWFSRSWLCPAHGQLARYRKEPTDAG